MVFFYVGPPKEDIFSDHLLWSIFHLYSTHIFHRLQILMWAFWGQHSMYCINSSVSYYSCVHHKRERFSPLFFFISLQGNTLPLTNYVTSPHCFDSAFTSDVTSQLIKRERGGALDSKDPDPYYLSLICLVTITFFILLSCNIFLNSCSIECLL